MKTRKTMAFSALMLMPMVASAGTLVQVSEPGVLPLMALALVTAAVIKFKSKNK